MEGGEVIRNGDVFQLHGCDRQAVHDERHGEAIEITQPRITGRGLAALEHEGIAHHYAKAGGAAIPFHVRLFHVVERVEDELQLGGVGVGNTFAILRSGGAGITAIENALRPGGDFVLPDVRLKQRGGEGGLPVFAVIGPVVVGVVLDGVVQVPDRTAGGTDEILHGAVFEEGSFKRARADFATILVRFAGGAGPDLGDVAIAALNFSETGFGADNAPLGVVEEAVRG